ncbi:MAG: ABC-F family ATP-binding cassette domain-containing protein [Candidatus Cloacimonetes bacterium]|nr:ABC-F family ATP-binding cassette domain-containing protein [Candidatus Cloacimonadota bacterium]
MSSCFIAGTFFIKNKEGVNIARVLITAENINKAFGEKVVLKDCSFGIHEGSKIGIIGANGTGKSTLMKLLAGKSIPDKGRITYRNEIRAVFLPQEPDFNDQNTVIEQVYESDQPHFEIIREYHHLRIHLEGNNTPEMMHRLSELSEYMDINKIWDIESEARSLLTQFGLTDTDKPVSLLSGGQKRKLDIVRTIIGKPDILLLDEPTNHLDIDTIEWLQNYLTDFVGTILFVTHDRYFLDSICNIIAEVDLGMVQWYEGNYSYYVEKKQTEITALQRKETRRKAQLQKEMKWLQRGAKARTSKPKNHIDRVKELIDKSYLIENKELEISFANQRLGKTILELRNISKAYDENMLLNNFTHLFQKNERIGVLGPNGCGKTTLLRLITGEIEPDTGSVKVGINTSFAYYTQAMEDLPPEKRVLEYITDYAENIRTKDGVLHSATEMLERFLFDGKHQQSKIKSLSGGEKKRLYLLKSLMFGANFVILDEPTNDLDLQTLEILEDYLDAFQGCVLVVSHDRFFLDRVVDCLFIFEPDRVHKFAGNYSDYLLVKRFKKAEESEQKKEAPVRVEKTPSKLTYKLQRELESIQSKIDEIEARMSELEEILQSMAATLSGDEFIAIDRENKKLESELDTLLHRWEEIEASQ